MAPASLFERHPKRVDVPIVAAVSLVALGFGIALPAIQFDNLGPDNEFSVLTGIYGFVVSGNLLLALLLFAFSVVFPTVKLASVLVLWFARIDAEARRATVGWLEALGKWSLLDTFVIAVLLGTVQLGILSAAHAQPGVYLYFAAILGSLVATFMMRPFVHDAQSEAAVRPLRRVGLLCTVPAAVLYGVGLSLPLVEVEKAWFWGNEYSLLEGVADLWRRGEHLLAAGLGLLVVVLPSVRYLGLIALRIASSLPDRATRALRLLDFWSMGEVFVLAILVVMTKLGDFATPTPRAGMWFLLAAALLTVVDSVLLHRSVRRAGR